VTVPKQRISDVIGELEGVNLRKLKADLLRALEREKACGTTIPDGFPGGGDGQGSPGVSKPTEAAVAARERARLDVLRTNTTGAARALLKGVEEIRRCQDLLRNMADLTSDTPITPKGCDQCTTAGRKVDGEPIPWEHPRTDVNGRLPRGMFLCDPHYRFVQKHGHLPTGKQEKRHASGLGWGPT
jgi:hypothetical protein